MLPATNQGVGQNVGAPDPCATPPVGVPVPYPNMGMDSTALPVIPNVMVSNLPSQNMTCKPPMTNGDNAGVMSPFMGPGGLTVGNPIVQINGMGAAHLTLPSYGNNYVCAAGVKAVPSVTNVLICWRARAGATWTPAELRQLPQLLSDPAGGVRCELTPDRIGRLRIDRFGLATTAALAQALRRLRPAGARALTLDLRGNPGGSLAAALTSAQLLASVPRELPLVVVQDRATASAAEVCAAWLQDAGRALVVGEPSYGKGRVGRARLGPQRVALDPHAGWVRRHDGAPLHGLGVIPDLLVATHEAPAAADLLTA
jgi:carboxyl-terminal processing protease